MYNIKKRIDLWSVLTLIVWQVVLEGFGSEKSMFNIPYTHSSKGHTLNEDGTQGRQ